MKNLIVIAVLSTILAACTNKKAEGFSGIYVRQIGQEYAKGNDTVIISAIPDNPNAFDLLKRSSFQRVLNGRLQEKRESKVQHMTGVLDTQRKLLYETRHGIILSLGSDGQELHWGATIYHRIQ